MLGLAVSEQGCLCAQAGALLCSVSCLTPLPSGVSKCYLIPFKFKEFQSPIFRSAPVSIDLVPGWLPRLFSGSSSDVPNWMEISQEHLNL